MDKKIPTRVIVVGIVQNDTKILLGKKSKGRPPYPDVWHTIGGGTADLELSLKLINDGDYDNPYFDNELRREIKEESGLDIFNIKNICPAYKENPREDITKNKYGEDTHYIFLEYFCDAEQSATKPADDIAELVWVEREDLKKYNLTPPSQAMYRELGWL